MSWREIQKSNFKRLSDLANFLEIEIERSGDFSFINVPKRLAEKMPKGTLEDPITRQFFPLSDTVEDPSDFAADPVCDHLFRQSPKLLKKYKGRALLLTTSACAMHCSYCFRQNFPYSPKSHFEEEIALIEKDTSLHEVILSGGDPLSLANDRLEFLLKSLNRMPHIRLIRFHTRFPIGIPERIEESLLDLLNGLNTQLIFVVHANHMRELDSDVLCALKKVQQLGIPVLLQTVLLKKVNDSVSVLKELFLLCIQWGIIPYYLHQLDKVSKASHFEVDLDVGRALISSLRAQLPGYAVPLYVREIPGESGKTPLL